MSAPSSPRAAGARASRPRLLLLTPDFPPGRGGIQVLLHRLAAGLGEFDVRVLTLSVPGATAFDATSTIATSRVPSHARLGAARNVALNLAALAAAARFHPQLTLSAHIVTSPAAAAIRRASGVPTVQYFYAKEIGDKPRLAAFAARHADAAISISSYTSALLEARGAVPGVLRLIAPGVEPPRDPSPLPAMRPTILTVSRLADRYKGHDVMLRALALVRETVPDVEWVVIGDGPLRAELEAGARTAGLTGAVSFLGALSDAERDEWLRRASVFAMPSRLPPAPLAGEGFGIVYLEAASYGKPVVAGNVAGAVDAVRDGETGLLVDPSDPAALAAAITRVLCEPELAARLGGAGAEWARGFAWPVMVERVEGLLRERLSP